MTNLSELREKAVLPLVWGQPTGPWTFVASPLGLTYRVSESLGGDDATWELRLGNSIVGIYHSEGEAKAAAQADYAQRILSAIDPSLFERIAALEAGRDERQRQVAEWCAAAFGADHQASVPQRGLRMLEEAIEAYQATAGSCEVAHRLIDYIFAKEPGELRQELGGLGVTVLALAAAAGLSADDAETAEISRVLSKPLAWFHARNKVKNDAGFDATAYPSSAPTGAQP